jgi:hypothetical protein
MKVLICSTHPNPPAERALAFEGIPCKLLRVQDEYDYGRHIYRWWGEDDLIILEHDTIPWVGALTHLQLCPKPCCAHAYPFAPNAVRIALGCLKISLDLQEACEETFDLSELAHTRWNEVDAVLYRALQSQGIDKPHLHGPPFAHVKGSCVDQSHTT